MQFTVNDAKYLLESNQLYQENCKSVIKRFGESNLRLGSSNMLSLDFNRDYYVFLWLNEELYELEIVKYRNSTLKYTNTHRQRYVLFEKKQFLSISQALTVLNAIMDCGFIRKREYQICIGCLKPLSKKELSVRVCFACKNKLNLSFVNTRGGSNKDE